MVPTSPVSRLNASLNNTTNIIQNKSLNAAGAALYNTFRRNLPLTFSVLGSRDNTKAGAHIVNMMIRVMLAGLIGYTNTAIIAMIARKKENIFLTKNSDAVRSILFITRLPSATTEGMAAKKRFSLR